MIEQAGGAPRLGLVVGARRHLARKADGAVDQAAQPIAERLRHHATVIEPGVQIG